MSRGQTHAVPLAPAETIPRALCSCRRSSREQRGQCLDSTRGAPPRHQPAYSPASYCTPPSTPPSCSATWRRRPPRRARGGDASVARSVHRFGSGTMSSRRRRRRLRVISAAFLSSMFPSKPASPKPLICESSGRRRWKAGGSKSDGETFKIVLEAPTMTTLVTESSPELGLADHHIQRDQWRRTRRSCTRHRRRPASATLLAASEKQMDYGAVVETYVPVTIAETLAGFSSRSSKHD